MLVINIKLLDCKKSENQKHVYKDDNYELNLFNCSRIVHTYTTHYQKFA